MTQKVFFLENLDIDVEEKNANGKISKSLKIAGYANTVDKDRVGDIVLPEAWAKGIANFRKNPILLYQHDHHKPIGKVDEIVVDKKGIFVKASVSEAAEKQHSVQTLIKDGVLKSFSVGFRIKDADYAKDSDTFIIKDVELLEISVVSVPANQESLFSIRKGFDNDQEYKEFKETIKKESIKDLMEEAAEEIVEEEKEDVIEEQVETVASEEQEETKEAVTEEVKETPVEETPLEASTEEEEEEIEETDPYVPIPFTNLLNQEVNELKSGDVVVLNKSRYIVDEIATTDTPYYKLTEVDLAGRSLDKSTQILSTNLFVVNPWDFSTKYDIHLIDLSTLENNLTDKNRESIKEKFKLNILSSGQELVKIKSSIDEPRQQKVVNDLINLTIESNWSDAHYEIANKYATVVDYLESFEEKDENILNELKIYGKTYDDRINSEEEESSEDTTETSKENENMATQDIGDPIVVKTTSEDKSDSKASSHVSEPEVAKLIEKTGDAMLRDADNQDKADLNGSKRDGRLAEELAELRGQLSAYKEQVSAYTTSKNVYQQSTRTAPTATRKEMADAFFIAKALGKDVRNTNYGKQILEKAVISGSSSDSPLELAFSEDIYEEMEQQLVIAPLFNRVSVPSKSYHIPVASEDTDEAVAQFPSGVYATGPTDSTRVADDKQHTLTSVELSPHKFMAATFITKDEEEDSLIALLPFLRQTSTRRMARFLDKVLLRGTGALGAFSNSASLVAGTGVSSPVKGVVNLSAGVAGLITYTGGATNKANSTTIATARSTMGKYGLSTPNNLVYLTTVEGYNTLVQESNFQTVDKFGPQATFLTGSLGAVYGIPIVITEFLDNSGTANNDIGLLMYKPGFIVAERRAMEVESEYLPRQQVNALYMSTRMDMKALTTVASAALSTTYSYASVVRSGAAS